MAGINKMLLIGRLGQNPEVKYAQSGTAVCNFSVATSEEWTDKQSGQKQEKTEWHRVICFNKLAENCGKYLVKGKQVYVEGKLQTSSYEKDGQTHYATKIMADVVQFLGDSGSGGQGQSQEKQQGGYNPQQQNQGYNPTPQSQQRQQPQQQSQFAYDDGSIPF
ncbi:MAG: single-stranded DNA-binding protein [Desulfamplus sp.]|nr:single-stranded DNA-binding protein [Desulfamplus sp.]